MLLFLPNVIWMLLPKADIAEQGSVPLFLTIAENLGRAAVLILPIMYPLKSDKKYSIMVMIGMSIALAIYYASWVRYFIGGRSSELFTASLIGIPLPMAVAPIIFLILSSYLLESWMVFGASVFFGVTHIWVSAMDL